MSRINLGDEVKDEVSGFTGIAVAVHNYLNGCSRVSIQPRVGKDGKMPDSSTFDEPNLVLVKAAKVKRGPINTGGPEKYMPTRRPGE